ncbi:MAG TPA: DUF4190 domain-containing protein [Pirellulales bacterium]|nr:DUF4190 domain-containing protein [Pirellulales bacterium]
MYCRNCGLLLPEPPTACPRCGIAPGAPLVRPASPPNQPMPYAQQSPYPYPQASDIGENAGMRMLLPVGRSWWSIAAGYMGLFSILLFPAPLALILGIVAIVDIKKHPGRHGMGRAIFAIVMSVLGPALVVGLIVATNQRHW